MGRIILTFLSGFIWLFYLQPRKIQKLWIKGFGFVLSLFAWREKVVDQNIEFAYPHHLEKKKLLKKAAYEHLASTVFEELLLLGPLPRFVNRYADVKGAENWSAAHQKGKGVIFLSSHVGNWEVMSASAVGIGIDLLIVTKKLKPQWLHDAVERGRHKAGFSGTYEPRTFRDIMRHLKKGKTVGFILDQYAGPPVGVRVPFFGVPVGTHSVVALVAKRTGAPVVPVLNYRQPNGRWTVEIQPALHWQTDENPQREIALNTAYYAQVVEKHVKDHPEQWLWVHRRFKGELGPLQEEEWLEGRTRK